MNRPVNPVMITLARESRGVSQKALAKRLDMSQAAVSKLENGQIKADDEILFILIDFFDYPDSFFCRAFEIYPLGMQFYRKHKTLPARLSKRIEAALNIYRLHVSQLLVSAEVTFMPLPDLDVDRYGRAWKIARALRQYLKLPPGPIANVTEVLEKLGIVIVPFDPETSMFSGVSMLLNTENNLILVNSQMPADRLRWTLVHELAHIIMHSLPSETMEAEAEEFTGEFLMPAEEIAPEIKGLTIERLAALKRRWKVSMNVIVTNSHKRRMLTDWEDRMLRIKMADNGITRTREPALSLPIERPVLLSELLDFHLHDLEYSLPEVSNLVGLHEPELLTKLQPALRSPTVVARTRPKLSLVHSR
jgi:Zn-dependent peptidase ImmA (M78 family)/transcriptional regulator with XRE-family HTH domain